jgi:nitrite reductase/ring-hydroxylating ferredoxin subunit
MELPDSIKGLGDELAAGGEVAPAPELFDAYDVFAAELARIFTRPWLAIDHQSRLAADGDFVRAEAGARSVVVVREKEGRIHALRNACLHAGYRVCEAEAGRADQLYCQYHGWSYALDGRLLDPLLRPEMTDRSRFRLPRYAMRIERGLILVDLSALAPQPPAPGPVVLGAIPEDLGERVVSRRRRYHTTVNWKRLRHFLWARPGLAFGGDGVDAAEALGPLSLLAMRQGDAALLRLVPRFPGHTDVELVEMPRPGGAKPAGAALDPIGDALRERGEEIAAAPLGRDFFRWYWPLMAPG